MPPRKKIEATAVATTTTPTVYSEDLPRGMGQTTAIGRLGEQGNYPSYASIFGVRNPNALLWRLPAKQSLSAAMQFYALQDQWYWDSLDEMANKSITIGAVQETVVDQVLRLTATIKLDSEETPEATALRDRIEKNLLPQINDIARFMVTGTLQHGISIGENIFEIESDGFLGLKKCIHTHPGLYAFNNQAELCMWLKSDYYEQGQPLPTWKFPLMRRFALYNNPWGDSLVGKLVVPYFGEMKTSERLLQLIDRYGLPIAVAKLRQAGGDPNNPQYLEMKKAALIAALNAITEGAAGMVLDGDVESLEWKDKAFGAAALPHFTALTYYEKQMVRRYLGATLGFLEAEFGTRAQAEVHASIGDLKTKPLSQQLCDTITEGIIDPLIEFNWNPADGPAPTIRLDVDTKDPISLEDAIKRIEAAAKYKLGMTEKQAQDELNIMPATDGEPVVVAPPEPGGFPGAPLPGLGMDETNAPTDGTLQVTDAEAENMDFLTTGEAARIRNCSPRSLLPWLKGAALRQGKPVRVSRGRVHKGDFMDVWNGDIRTIGAVPVETEPEAEPGTDNPFDDGSALAPPAIFAEDQPTLSAAERAKIAKANRVARAKTEQGYVLRMRKIASALTTDSQPAAQEAAKAALDKAREGKDLAVKFNPPVEVQTGLMASSLLALAAGGAQYGAALKTFAEPEKIDPRFKPAVDWMRSRGILSTAELEMFTASLNTALALSEETITPAIVERTVRSQFLALKKSTSDIMTEKINNSLASSLNSGGSFQDWMATTRNQIDTGEISAVSDPYLENVYRTETGNAYSAQQSALESSPAVSSALLGWTVMNPDDSRSRESHARLNGLFFPKGHPATAELGRPPFSYQCRCVFVPEIGTAAMAPEVNPNLSEIAGRVEKFSECCHH